MFELRGALERCVAPRLGPARRPGLLVTRKSRQQSRADSSGVRRRRVRQFDEVVAKFTCDGKIEPIAIENALRSTSLHQIAAPEADSPTPLRLALVHRFRSSRSDRSRTRCRCSSIWQAVPRALERAAEPRSFAKKADHEFQDLSPGSATPSVLASASSESMATMRKPAYSNRLMASSGATNR